MNKFDMAHYGNLTYARSDHIIIAALIVVSIIYLVFLFPSPELPRLNKDDGSLFMTLAINIAEHGRYSMDTTGTGNAGYHATWPPAFPLYLAAIVRIFGVSWIAIKIGMVVAGLATLTVLWRLFPANTPGRFAVLLTALNPYFFLYSHHYMAEVPYMLAVLCALLLLDKSDTRGDMALAGSMAALAFLTRGYAVMLLPVGLIFILLKPGIMISERIWLCANYATPLVTAVAIWAVYTSYMIGTGDIDDFTARYGNGADRLSNLMLSPFEHLQRLYWHDGRYAGLLLVPILLTDLGKNSLSLFLLSASVISLAMLGWALGFSTRSSSINIWVPASILMLWSTGPSLRYWLPLLPFILYFSLSGAQYISKQAHSLRLFYPALLALLLTSGVAGFVTHLTSSNHLRFYDDYGIQNRDIMLWARENLPEKAVVITEAPGDVFSIARRSAIRIDAIIKDMRNLSHFASYGLYLLCPTSNISNTHYSETFGICSTIIGQGNFTVRKELPLIAIYEYSLRVDGSQTSDVE